MELMCTKSIEIKLMSLLTPVIATMNGFYKFLARFSGEFFLNFYFI